MGEETSRAVWRTRTYAGEDRPNIEALRGQIIGKYGDAHVDNSNQCCTPAMVWDFRDPPLSRSSPHFSRCIPA